MKKKLHVDIKDQVVLQADRICYWQRQDWCEGRYRQLNFSLMKPRCHYAYDKDETYPLILWITGGSFIEEDINIWMPELVYYVKHGYAVAGVDYSINDGTGGYQSLYPLYPGSCKGSSYRSGSNWNYG